MRKGREQDGEVGRGREGRGDTKRMRPREGDSGEQGERGDTRRRDEMQYKKDTHPANIVS
jgi:hypothetical protein